MDTSSDDVLLVGTGPMAIEYGKVLKGLKKKIIAVGLDEKSTREFNEALKVKAETGGISEWLKRNKDYPKCAIVVVNENLLGKIAMELLENGLKSILVEKPGGRDPKEIVEVAKLAKRKRGKVFVGYNRRFYASVQKAEEIIKKDGGVTSFNFEFTEWAFKIEPLVKAPGVKEVWYYHNSTHVIDLAFWLGGEPKNICAYTTGKLKWHPAGSIFAGAGATEQGALFSYQANWESPGRWWVEALTKKHRLILRPMETLQIQNIGSVAVEEVKINDAVDLKYKAGLYGQVEAYLSGKRGRLCTIEEQAKNLDFYKKILGVKGGL